MQVLRRKSTMSLGRIYFWTATIYQWNHLLASQANKNILLNYLGFLVQKDLITLYAIVIMPNHIHLIWRLNKYNGSESPSSSFLKHTAHELLKELKKRDKADIYRVDARNKKHNIWRRDSLAIEIYSRAAARQKLAYIHCNPLRGKWRLANTDIEYPYSSARFYETGVDDFGFLSDLYTVFDGE